jgi:hypothetical protein
MALATARSRVGPVELLHCDPDLALGTSKDIFFCLWRDKTTLPGVEKLRTTFASYARDRDGTALVTTIAAGADLHPTAAARDELAAWLRSVGDQLVISALVFEGSGFMAATVRSVVTGLTLLARQPFPHKVFGDIDAATLWFEDATKTSAKKYDAERVREAARTFRRLVDERAIG